MGFFKVGLDKETEKQIRNEIFRPVILSILIGLCASVVCALVASGTLGLTIKDKVYNFGLNHSDGWIIFTIFITVFFATSVVAYYRLKDEHQKLTDDFLTPFRKELAGNWRVYWTDLVYANENGEVKLKNHTKKDSCYIGIDNVGKLFIESELNRDDMLEDWKNRIEDISINLQKNRLTFYDESQFTIRRELMKNDTDNRSFDARFFVFLEVKERDDDNRVIKYEGRWYDLDGSFSKFKETIAHQLHQDLPDDISFPRSGEIYYVKSPQLNVT